MFSDIIWRPALAFFMMLVFMFVAFKKRGAGVICFALFGIANQLTYFIVIAAQDARYSYIIMTICIVMLVLAITPKSTAQKLSAKAGDTHE